MKPQTSNILFSYINIFQLIQIFTKFRTKFLHFRSLRFEGDQKHFIKAMISGNLRNLKMITNTSYSQLVNMGIIWEF